MAKPLRPEVKSWIEKAEGDFDAALLLFKAKGKKNFDAVCFHAQQCLEKYFKARLTHEQSLYSDTSDLGILLNHSLKFEAAWESQRDSLERLSAFAKRALSPGFDCSSADAKLAMKACGELRKAMRFSLGIKGR